VSSGADVRLVFSLSPSLQLAALSPIALAIPHKPRFLGGIGGGFSPVVPVDALFSVDTADR